MKLGLNFILFGAIFSPQKHDASAVLGGCVHFMDGPSVRAQWEEITVTVFQNKGHSRFNLWS